MANDKTDRWEKFNLIIDQENIDIKEKGLLLILFRYINYKTGYANPSRTLIKKLYGTNKNDVLDKTMNSLINKGYLTRVSGKGIRSKYFIKVDTQIEPSTKKELSTNLVSVADAQIEPTLGTQIEPQKENKKKTKENIYLNLKFVDEVIDKVKITQEQYEKLITKFNKAIVHKNIIAMDNYIANGKGSKYKDHYRALNTWCSKDSNNQTQTKKQPAQQGTIYPKCRTV